MTIGDGRISQKTLLPLIRPLLFMQSIGLSPVVGCITQSALYQLYLRQSFGNSYQLLNCWQHELLPCWIMPYLYPMTHRHELN